MLVPAQLDLNWLRFRVGRSQFAYTRQQPQTYCWEMEIQRKSNTFPSISSLTLTIYLFIYLYIYTYIYRCIDVDHAPYRPHWEISLKTNCSWRWLCKNPYTNNKSTTIHCISITKSIMYHTLNYIYMYLIENIYLFDCIFDCVQCSVLLLYIVDI